jgi:alkanesulfonate monooxygenase SsuD/methylene tetrahydromethanopterin reductase-like flavin-dependent oxidoreductase (luciferase family)
MEYFANFPAGSETDPAAWASRKESEGWHGVCASDHLWVGDTRYPHVFVAATQMACATSSIRLTTSFCNNLFRSPVEFAQAALSLQAAAGGRFEAGLGAGWAQDEMVAMGCDYPDAPTRVSRYVEALTIVRALLETGRCRFEGTYYQVDVSGDRRLLAIEQSTPPLIASAGGPRALREVTPLVDRVEIKASARATRGGHLDFETMSTVTKDEIVANVQRVRSISQTIPIGIFILIAVGSDPQTAAVKAGLGAGYLSRFIGEPEEVAEALGELEDMGIARVQLTELVPGSHARLADRLL